MRSASIPSSIVIGGSPLLQDVLSEVLQLIRVGVAEAFHEVRHGVVRDAVGLGHHDDRRLAQVADADGAFESEDLGGNVIAVDAAAREIDDAELAAREGQAGDRVVDVADGLEFRIGDASRRSRRPMRTSPMNQRARSKS